MFSLILMAVTMFGTTVASSFEYVSLNDSSIQQQHVCSLACQWLVCVCVCVCVFLVLMLIMTQLSFYYSAFIFLYGFTEISISVFGIFKTKTATH